MNYKVKEYGNKIYEIENFISKELSELLLSFVDLEGDSDWDNTHPGNTISVPRDRKLENFREICKKLQFKIQKLFLNSTRCSEITNIKRLSTGESMQAHKDLGYSHEEPIKYGAVIYLNDDFDGGELYYKSFDIKIKPKALSILIHDSKNTHEVLKVNSGKRYCLTAFIYGDHATELKL